MRGSDLVLVLAFVAGCGRDDARAGSGHRVGAAARPDLSNATQHDLAIELEQAERRGTWREVRRRWEGQTLRWTVTRHQALCRDEASCHVAAFPVQRPAQNGWLPSLSFASGEFAKLEAACGGAPRCELEVEGTLARLELSAELPTSVHFANVRLRSAKRS